MAVWVVLGVLGWHALQGSAVHLGQESTSSGEKVSVFLARLLQEGKNLPPIGEGNARYSWARWETARYQGGIYETVPRWFKLTGPASPGYLSYSCTDPTVAGLPSDYAVTKAESYDLCVQFQRENGAMKTCCSQAGACICLSGGGVYWTCASEVHVGDNDPDKADVGESCSKAL